MPISGKYPLTKETDNPLENFTLLRHVPAAMGPYEFTYLIDSSGNEKGRRFYELLFQRKDESTKKVVEQFTLWPDVYIMKDNNMSSNPDTKTYLGKDIFTFISYAVSDKAKEETAQFIIKELAEGDTAFYSNGYMVLGNVAKSPKGGKVIIEPSQMGLMAELNITSKENMHFKAQPVIIIDSLGITNADDTVYAQNLFVRFIGVKEDKKLRIGIKESDKLIDYVTIKAYVFPLINLVWLGLVVMAAGLILSMLQRGSFTRIQSGLILIVGTAFVFYMFLLANG